MTAKKELYWEESMQKHTRKQCRPEVAKTAASSQGPKCEARELAAHLGENKKKGEGGGDGIGWETSGQSLPLSRPQFPHLGNDKELGDP